MVGRVLAVLVVVWGVLLGVCLFPLAYLARGAAPEIVNVAVLFGAAFWLCAVGEAVCDLWKWLRRRLAPKPCPECRNRKFSDEAAFYLSGGLEDSSFIWCPNGHLMTPVLVENGNSVEVVAVGCAECGASMPVSVGVVLTDEMVF
jgi:hypothetical protein